MRGLIDMTNETPSACVKKLGVKRLKDVSEFYGKAHDYFIRSFKSNKKSFDAMMAGYIIVSQGYSVVLIGGRPILIEGGF
jgi:hypothetical protein